MDQWISLLFWQSYWEAFLPGNIKQSKQPVVMDLNPTLMIIKNSLKDYLKSNSPKREKFLGLIC